MEFGLKIVSRVCRGRHGEVRIVEFGLKKSSLDRCYVADRKETLVDDVVTFHLSLVPLPIRVVRDRDHFSTVDLHLFCISWLEVIIYVNLQLKNTSKAQIHEGWAVCHDGNINCVNHASQNRLDIIISIFLN